MGLLEQAAARRGRPGEGSLDVPEQLALQQPFRDRRDVDRDEAALRARAEPVERARHQLLSRSAFPLDHDARAPGRDARHHLVHLEHALRAAGDVLEALGDAGVLLRLDRLRLALLLHRAAQHRAHHLERGRLGKVVVGAGADRLHGGVDRRVAGDHDDRNLRRLVQHVAQQVEAVLATEVQVREDDVEGRFREALDGRLHAARDHDLVAEVLRHPLDDSSGLRLIVDDQDARARGSARGVQYANLAATRGVAPRGPRRKGGKTPNALGRLRRDRTAEPPDSGAEHSAGPKRRTMAGARQPC